MSSVRLLIFTLLFFAFPIISDAQEWTTHVRQEVLFDHEHGLAYQSGIEIGYRFKFDIEVGIFYQHEKPFQEVTKRRLYMGGYIGFVHTDLWKNAKLYLQIAYGDGVYFPDYYHEYDDRTLTFAGYAGVLQKIGKFEMKIMATNRLSCIGAMITIGKIFNNKHNE